MGAVDSAGVTGGRKIGVWQPPSSSCTEKAGRLWAHRAVSSHRLLGQVVQTVVDLQLWTHRDSRVHFGLEDVPLLTWLLGCLSLVLVVVTNEIVKLHEIR